MPNDDDDNDDLIEEDSFSRTVKLVHLPNSGISPEPFVTVKHRRRSVKERREETNHFVPHPTRFVVNSSSMNHDKRRVSGASQHDPSRSSPRNSLSNIKPTVPSMAKETSPALTPAEPAAFDSCGKVALPSSSLLSLLQFIVDIVGETTLQSSARGLSEQIGQRGIERCFLRLRHRYDQREECPGSEQS